MRSARFCLQVDGVEQFEGATLLWVGSGSDGEGWGLVAGVGSTAGIADDSGELLLKRGEAVRGGAVVEGVSCHLGLGGDRTFGRGDRIAGWTCPGFVDD